MLYEQTADLRILRGSVYLSLVVFIALAQDLFTHERKR